LDQKKKKKKKKGVHETLLDSRGLSAAFGGLSLVGSLPPVRLYLRESGQKKKKKSRRSQIHTQNPTPNTNSKYPFWLGSLIWVIVFLCGL
jgi:hypothetical protein